jgi:hypothetical protein
MELQNFKTGKTEEIDINWVKYNLFKILEKTADFDATFIASTLVIEFGTKSFCLQMKNLNSYPETIKLCLAEIYINYKTPQHVYYADALKVIK